MPAHPNTLSYEVAVFEEEVTSVHRANRQTRSEWLASQPPKLQAQVLNSWGKQRAFNAGLLRENGFTTPWKVIKKRLERRGIDVNNLPRAPATIIAGLNKHVNPYAIRTRPDYINGNINVRRALNQYVSGVGLKGASVGMLNSVYAAFDVVLGRFNLDISSLRWTSWDEAAGFYNTRTFQIALNHSVERSLHQTPGENNALFLIRKEKRIKKLERLLNIADESQKTAIRLALLRERLSTRFTVSSDSFDEVFAIMAHEAGHTLYFKKNLGKAWKDNLNRFNVNYMDYVMVSHYAGESIEELFSEVTAMLALGREADIPSSLLNAYNATIGTITGG